MTLSRRKILSLIGGGAILSAAVPATGFVLTRTPHKALQPWALAGNYDDPRMNAMSYALLAPNPHNRQPWLAELIGKNQVDIYRDPQRDLPVTDPFARQLTIGMGCFLELMEMAAEGLGFTVSTALFPDGEEGPVARCRFTPAQPKLDPLFAYVANRRSHKEGFKAKAVGDERAERLSSYARVFNKGAEVDILKRIAHDAWIAEATTPAAWQESIDLLRIGKAEINSNPDGINVGGPMLEALSILGIFTREAAADPENPGAKAAIESTANAILSSPAFTVITTPTNTRFDQIEAGRNWLRLNLATTGLGLALRPVSQSLQEYKEVQPFYDEIHERFAPANGTVQMLGLLGYGKSTSRTPRWPLETRMIDAPRGQ